MDSQMFSFFVQELVKEAVTVDDLYRGTTSAKNVNLDLAPEDRRSVRQQGGGVSIATDRQLKPALEQYAPNVTTNKMQDMLRRAPVKALRDQADKLDVLKHTPSSIPKQLRGIIAIDPDTVNTVVPALAGRPKLQSPYAQRALTALSTSHELAERRIAPRDIRRFQSHLAPEVLLKERNAIARLEGPGAREAADLLAAAREQTGEAQHMRNLLTNAYGPRAQQFLEGDQKVPKALLRGLRRKLRENPSILEAADPTRSMGFIDKLKAGKDSIARSARVTQAIKSLT
jgi:hypothetical protein